MYVQSLNSLSTLSGDTRILIVGTLTPPEGMAHGYFYSSFQAKKIYKMLDLALGNDWESESSFTKLVNLLICEKSVENKAAIIEKINSYLTENNLAFFDVVDSAIRKDPLDPSDTNLDDVSFAKDLYQERLGEKRSIKLFVFTSNTARDWFRNIDGSPATDSASVVWNIRGGRIRDEGVIQRIRESLSKPPAE